MKIKNGFVVREIAGEHVVVALGEACRTFNGMIRLNETGRLIWDGLSDGKSKEEIVDLILNEYEAERAVVEADYDKFISTLKGADILES